MKALAILIRNKHLIRLHKYGKLTFNFLNKHFYIVSLLSLIAKAKNNKLYKITSWIIKLILVINIFISSGLFFSLVDLTTPITAIYSFYDNLLSPYIDMITDKYNSLSNLGNKIETEYINNSNFKSNNDIKDTQEVVKEVDTSRNYYNYILYASATVLVLYLIYLPGPSIDPLEFEKFNWLNQVLMRGKFTIYEIIDAYKLVKNGGSFTEPMPPARSIEMTIIDADSNLESVKSSPILSPYFVESSNLPSTSKLSPILSHSDMPQVEIEDSSSDSGSDSGSEGSNESSSTLKGKGKAVLVDASTQTEWNGITFRKVVEFQEIANRALPKEAFVQIVDGVNKLIKKITD
jgi:hypothetical protein